MDVITFSKRDDGDQDEMCEACIFSDICAETYNLRYLIADGYQ